MVPPQQSRARLFRPMSVPAKSPVHLRYEQAGLAASEVCPRRSSRPICDCLCTRRFRAAEQAALIGSSMPDLVSQYEASCLEVCCVKAATAFALPCSSTDDGQHLESVSTVAAASSPGLRRFEVCPSLDDPGTRGYSSWLLSSSRCRQDDGAFRIWVASCHGAQVMLPLLAHAETHC